MIWADDIRRIVNTIQQLDKNTEYKTSEEI
jgi:hypothetical protein